MITQSTLYRIADRLTQCCSAPAVIIDQPRGRQLPELFCAGCLADVQLGAVVAHVHRMMVWQEWPWVDVAGGRERSAALLEEAQARAATVLFSALQRAIVECASVPAHAPVLDLGATWRSAGEVGDAVAAALYLFVLQVSVVVGRMAG